MIKINNKCEVPTDVKKTKKNLVEKEVQYFSLK